MSRFLHLIGSTIPEYRIRASRGGTEPSNLVCDAEFAPHYGFRAALIPGSSLYAYLSHSLIQFLGRDWLERGLTEFQLLQPIYEGEEVRISGVLSGIDRDGTLGIDCQASNSLGTVCATARIELPPRHAEPVPVRESYPAGTHTSPRPISLDSIQPGDALTPISSEFNDNIQWEYCQKGIRDHDPIYGRLPHPGWLLMQADRILKSNFHLPAWIHMASEVQHYWCQEEECVVETRGRIRDRYEREGDHYAILDLALFAGNRCLQTILQTIIFHIAPRAA